MEDQQNYYNVLGVTQNATEAEIRHAFRSRAKAYHPDIKPAGERGEAYHDFGLLTQAYETLKDESRRQAYDSELSRAQELAAGGGQRRKFPRAFAAGLGIGLAVSAILIGTKVSFDRYGRAFKSQESLRQDSLRIEKTPPVPVPGRKEAEGSAVPPAAAPPPTIEERAAAPAVDAASNGAEEVRRGPQAPDVTGDQIAPPKGEQNNAAAAAVQPADFSLQDRATGGRSHLAQAGMIEVASGPRSNETLLRLRPGSGLTESFSDCRSCPEMAVIPAGQAVIGSRPESANYRTEEAPAHKVSIRKPLAVSKHGVSAENWRACVDAGVCRPTLASFLSIGPAVPATRVSWLEAKAYVEWLSKSTGRRYRLLSEAEWEYAARAGAGSRLPQTAAQPLPAHGTPDPSLPRPGSAYKQIGLVRPNVWGIHALPNHVLEWVEDCWHPGYAQAPSDGSAWLSGGGGDCAYRVVRGVSTQGSEFGGPRPAARAREYAEARSPALGFRVARELPMPAKTALEAAGSGAKAARGE